MTDLPLALSIAGSDPIVARFDLEEHERASLGAGVEIEKLGSIELGPTWRGLCRLRFADRPDLASAETILLPAGAKFTLLAE